MTKKARDIMTRNVIVVEKETPINNLIEIFLDHKISCAPVVTKKKKLIGIVTKTDVLGYFLDLDLDLTLKVGLKDILEFGSEHSNMEISSETEQKVHTIMTKNPITAGENSTIESLAETMIDNNIHRVIIKKGGKVVGIVSTLDILHHIAGTDK